MNAQQKKGLKIVGVSLGIVFIIGGAVIIFILRKRKQDESYQEYNPPYTNSGTSPSEYGGGSTETPSLQYTKREVERMQTWLIQAATIKRNTIILNAIRSTGGIDGKIGNGFYTALHEAIKRGYIKDIHDLYNKSN